MSAQVPELMLETFAVAVMDSKTVHITGAHKAAKAAQVWPADWIDALPENLRNSQAIFWDTKSQTLVVVPHGAADWTGLNDDRVAKIVLRPNVETKAGIAGSVVSLGTSPRGDLLKSKQYKLLVGKL